MTDWWKIVAIVLIIVLVCENLLIFWGYSIVIEEEENMNVCYYEICSEYPEVYYQDYVCSCYDYDVLGNPMVVKQEYMK